MNKLQNEIDRTVYWYPSLFRVRNDIHLSRILCLNQMFLGAGGGYRWVDGCLVSDESRKRKIKLPDGFYEKEAWSYSIPCCTGKYVEPSVVASYFAGRCYTLVRRHKDTDIIVFDSLEAERKQFDGSEQTGLRLPPWLSAEADRGFRPNSLSFRHGNITKIPNNVQPEWLDGAYEIAEAALDYYESDAGKQHEVVEAEYDIAYSLERLKNRESCGDSDGEIELRNLWSLESKSDVPDFETAVRRLRARDMEERIDFFRLFLCERV